jgi:xanthine/uracil permease
MVCTPRLRFPQLLLLLLPLLLQGKFGGLFASLPAAMVSGLFCVMFGCICAGERW